MKRLTVTIFVLGLILCLPKLVVAQNLSETVITANFTQQPITTILNQLEKDYQIRFYYREKDLPNAPITGNYVDQSLDNVMTHLLENSIMGHFFYRNQAVIIAPQHTIQESYTADFYQTLEETIADGEEPDRAKKRQLIVGSIEDMSPTGKAMVKGIVKEKGKRDPIIGATVFWTDLETGTATDENGEFEMEVRTGKHQLSVNYVGYEEFTKTVVVYGDGEIKISLSEGSVNLDEVVVEADRPDANVENVQVGVERLDIKQIKKIPTFMGEADIVKSLLLQPGVSSIGEGATGFNVRGGDVDQNLLMLDEGFIFNASHALGFFSTFNTDLIKGVTLYKGNIPAQYGGRIASVLDVEMRSGNFEKFKIKGGLGLVSSRISLEGPVIKEKSSFLVGFRSTYSDWILNQFKVEEVKNSSAFFYDANLRYTHRINDKNTLIFSGYSSKDEFTFNNDFGFDYATYIGQMSFKTIFTEESYSDFSLTFSQYESTRHELDTILASKLDNQFQYYKFKENIHFVPADGLDMDVGISSILYKVDPGELTPTSEFSTITPGVLESEKGLESALFVNAQYNFSPAFQISGGLRFSFYNFLGPKETYQYLADSPLIVENITDTLQESGLIKTYSTLEPRFSLRYRLDANSSIKAGYSRTAQYINQIFNTDSPTPTSQWQLSTATVEPQRSHNFSIGYFRNMRENLWETSGEVFYRYIDQLFDYRDFAELVLNPHIETELLNGDGRAYGFELSLKKKTGLWHGALSYTLSRTEKRIAGINQGKAYPGNFDKPHDMSLVLNYQPNQRHTVTINFNYSTGRPTTPPVGSYITGSGLLIPVYTDRNQVRIPDYHRLDIAYTIGQGYRVDRKFKTSWTVSIYNVYARKNAFSVYFTQTPFSSAQANRFSVLGSIFPSLTFNLEIL